MQVFQPNSARVGLPLNRACRRGIEARSGFDGDTGLGVGVTSIGVGVGMGVGKGAGAAMDDGDVAIVGKVEAGLGEAGLGVAGDEVQLASSARSIADAIPATMDFRKRRETFNNICTFLSPGG